MAFRNGEDSIRAKVGALVLADGIDCLRAARAMVKAMAKKPGKRRR